jgi:hypothetical protein
VRTYTAPVSDTVEPVADPTTPVRPVPPRTINLVMVAVGAQVVFMAIRVVSMFGYTDQLTRLLEKSNRDAKHPKSPYGPAQVAHDLHTVRVNGMFQAVIVAIALALLAYSLRKVGTASMTRWALLIVLVMTGGPFTIIPSKGLPVVPQVALVLSGAASIVTIVLLFLPDSRRYFREIAAARSGAAAAAGGPARPGLLTALFRPQPRPAPGSAKAGARNAGGTGTSGREQVNLSKAPKAKARNDAEAVARGAELARSRAKASKSRRTEG